MKIYKTSKLIVDWNGIDWSKSNKQISQELGSEDSTVVKARKRYAPQTMKESYSTDIDWGNIDWGMRNVEIAMSFGIDPSVVSMQRGKYAPNTIRHRIRRPNEFRWESVDWSKSNREIAYSLLYDLIDRNMVKDEDLTHRRLDSIESLVSNRRIRYAPESKKQYVDWTTVDWTRPNKDLAIDIGVAHGYISKMRQKYAPETSSYNKETVSVILQNMKTARFFTIKELEEYGKNIPYSLLQCVDCGRWLDISDKKVIPEWKLESEMNGDEIKVVSDNKKEIANGRGRGFSTCKYCKERWLSSGSINWYKTAESSHKIPLTSDERELVKSTFGDNLECSFFKDKDGYYCTTHRARSKSYSSIDKIPKSEVEYIGGTG